MKRSVIWAVAGCVAALGCSKGGSSESSGPAGSASAPGPSASAPSAPVAPSASAAPAHATSTQWSGTYKSEATTFALPAGVKWKVPESTEGIGEGTLALTIEPPPGRVRGTVEGPLGPALVDGFAADGKVTATIARRDPSDHGFAGTLSAEVSGGHVRGTMNLAPAEVTAVRAATFDLAPASP
jgi:hypothetical protein